MRQLVTVDSNAGGDPAAGARGEVGANHQVVDPVAEDDHPSHAGHATGGSGSGCGAEPETQLCVLRSQSSSKKIKFLKPYFMLRYNDSLLVSLLSLQSPPATPDDILIQKMTCCSSRHQRHSLVSVAVSRPRSEK